jgi:chemotaxis protein MotB
MRKRRAILSDGDDTHVIWPSFTDVMSTMALVLFVLMLLAYVKNLVSAKRLEALGHQIDASQHQLGDLRSEIATARAALADSRAKLEDREAVVQQDARELDNLHGQLQSIAVLRVSVLNKLKEAIEEQLGASRPGTTNLVGIGDNGNIVVNESLVFEYNSYAIKPEARPTLDALAKALASVLGDPETRANIDTILIQGHTDDRGTASFNWDLSAKRATAVLDYLFHADKSLADSYGSFFAASAYSKFRPIDPAKTEEAYRRNRRIEIAVVAKDDNVRRIIDAYSHAPGAPNESDAAAPVPPRDP